MITTIELDGVTLPIEINIMTIRAAQSALRARGYDNINLLDSTDIILKFDDLWFVADFLLALSQEYRAEHGFTEYDVSIQLSGDTLGVVRNHLLDAYIDFFPGPETRTSLRKFATAVVELTAEKNREIATRATDTLKNFGSITGPTS